MSGELEGFSGRTVAARWSFAVRERLWTTCLLAKAAILPLQAGATRRSPTSAYALSRCFLHHGASAARGARIPTRAGAILREHPEIKVYSVSPFDLDERRRAKDRFGGDIVYFFNEAACHECERLGLSLQYLAEISDDELPRRRTLVVGLPSGWAVAHNPEIGWSKNLCGV